MTKKWYWPTRVGNFDYMACAQASKCGLEPTPRMLFMSQSVVFKSRSSLFTANYAASNPTEPCKEIPIRAATFLVHSNISLVLEHVMQVLGFIVIVSYFEVQKMRRI